MGIWEFIGSTVKRNAPDTTPLKDVCRSSFTYFSAAAKQIGRAIAEKMPDDETRSKIRLYLTKFAKNAWKECIQMIPGGAVFCNIVTNTIKDVERETENKTKNL